MTPASGHLFRLLVVDDSAIVRQRLCELLAEAPCVRHVIEAASGAEAWTLFERWSPDVVVLDIQLPDDSGLALLRRIKRASPPCLVIVLTNLQDLIFRQESQRLGADYFLHKATEFEQVPPLLRQRKQVALS